VRLRELTGCWSPTVVGRAGTGGTASVPPEKDARRIREGRLFRRDGSSNVPGETIRLNCSDGRRVCGDGWPAANGFEDEGAEELFDSVGDASPTIFPPRGKCRGYLILSPFWPTLSLRITSSLARSSTGRFLKLNVPKSSEGLELRAEMFWLDELLISKEEEGAVVRFLK